MIQQNLCTHYSHMQLWTFIYIYIFSHSLTKSDWGSSEIQALFHLGVGIQQINKIGKNFSLREADDNK